MGELGRRWRVSKRWQGRRVEGVQDGLIVGSDGGDWVVVAYPCMGRSEVIVSAASCAALLSWRLGLSVGARQLETLIVSSKTVWIDPWRMLTICWVIVLLMLTPSLLSLAKCASTRQFKWTESHQ